MNGSKLLKIKNPINSLNLTLESSTRQYQQNYLKNPLRSIIEIEDKIIDIISHARKSLLFHDANAWVKKEANPLFDITMGSYDEAEVCELAGLYLLGKLAPLIGTKNVGLYKDVGLAVIHQANGQKWTG